MFSGVVSALSLALVLGQAAPVLPAPPAAPLPQCVLSAQEQVLVQTLERDARGFRWWTWGWGGIYIAATVVQAGFIPFTKDAGDRIDWIVGAASSGLGVVVQVPFGLQIVNADTKVKRLVAACRPRAEIDAALAAAADLEASGLGWIAHLVNLAFNLADTLVLGLVFHRWESAAISGGAGLVIGEGTIWTQPQGLLRLRRKSGRPAGPGPALSLSLAPAMMDRGGGVAARLSW